MNLFAKGLIFMLAIDLFLLLGQASVCNINPDNCVVFWGATGSALSDPDLTDGNYTMITDEMDYSSVGSNEGGGILASIENFIDGIAAATNWLTSKARVVTNFLFAPYYFLMAIGTPQEVCFYIGAFWFSLMSIALFAGVIFGRDV